MKRFYAALEPSKSDFEFILDSSEKNYKGKRKKMSLENTDEYKASKAILDKIEAVMTSKLVDNSRYPGSLSEIHQIKALLKELNKIECNDETIKERTAHYKNVVKTAVQYNYTGSLKFLVIMAVIVTVSFFLAMENYKSTSDLMKMEEAQEIHKNKILNGERNVKKYSKDVQAKKRRIKVLKSKNTGVSEATNRRIQDKMETLAELEMKLKESEQFLSDAQKETPEMILNANNGKILKEKRMRLLFNIYLICLPFLYFFSARMPQYMQVKRAGQLEAKKSSIKVFQAIFTGIVMLYMSQPKVTTTTTWSDGSITRKTDDSGSAAAVGVIIFAVVVLYFAIGYVLPVIILMNLWSNYRPVLLEKKRLKEV